FGGTLMHPARISQPGKRERSGEDQGVFGRPSGGLIVALPVSGSGKTEAGIEGASGGVVRAHFQEQARGAHLAGGARGTRYQRPAHAVASGIGRDRDGEDFG